MVNSIESRIESERISHAAGIELTLGAALQPHPAPTLLVRHIASSAVEHRCPNCRSIVYTRRHRLCAVCSRPLPEECLFTAAEARRIEAVMDFERREHRRWLEERTARSR